MIEALMAIIFENMKADYRDGDDAMFLHTDECINLRKIAQAVIDRRAEWEAKA